MNTLSDGRTGTWRRLLQNRPAVLGLGLVTAICGIAVLAPLLPLSDPHATQLDRRLAPALTPGHWLGTDHLGRDMLSRLIWGTRASLAVGLFATLVAAVAGTLIGLIAGYAGRWTDTVMMRGIDVLMAFPYLLLALAIVAALGPGLRNAMVAIAVVNIPFFARTVRGAALSMKQREFVDAARLMGFTTPRILGAEILPNVLPAVVVMMGTTLGWMILETAGLSFLGLGAQPPGADLGSMLGEGREFLTVVPRVAVLPGLVILLLVVGINLFGDGARDALDPRHVTRRIRHRRPHAPPATPPAPDRAAGEGGDAVLALERLSTAFDGEPAVDGVDLRLSPGERVALVGESGSGKTQTALASLDLLPPAARVTGGQVRYGREVITGAPPQRLRRLRGATVAYVPQNPQDALDPLFRIGEQLTETLHSHRPMSAGMARGRALELLGLVRLPQPQRVLRAYPHQLSGGMRQRAAIALAIANRPRILVADEATTALDVTVQAGIIRLLDELCTQLGMALLFITHDLGLVGRLCDRALILYAGRIVEAAPVDALFARPRHPYTRALIDCAPVLGHPEKVLRPIPGAPPPMDNRPPGCHFAPRCHYVEPRCREGELALRPLAPQRHARCVRAAELEL